MITLCQKNWKLGSISKLLIKIDNAGTTGSGRRRTVRTDANTGPVKDLVQFQENQPQTHKCVFDRAGGSYFERDLLWPLHLRLLTTKTLDISYRLNKHRPKSERSDYVPCSR